MKSSGKNDSLKHSRSEMPLIDAGWKCESALCLFCSSADGADSSHPCQARGQAEAMEAEREAAVSMVQVLPSH